MKQIQTSRELEERIGYTFKVPALLEEALTHPSCGPEFETRLKTNERFAFVGDRIVNLLVAEELHRRLDGPPEVLERKRGSLSSNYRLAEAARHIELGLYLYVGNCGDEEDEKLRKTESVLATAMEALIGGVFLDSERNYVVVATIFTPQLFANLDKVFNRGTSSSNKVIKLQKLAQERFGVAPRYCASHKKPDWVVVELYFGEHKVATGSGSNEQVARKRAATMVLTKTMNLTCNLPDGLTIQQV